MIFLKRVLELSAINNKIISTYTLLFIYPLMFLLHPMLFIFQGTILSEATTLNPSPI